jgi:putative MATE family efflux protein
MSLKMRESVLEMSLWALAWPLFVDAALTMLLGVEDSLYLARISDPAAAGVGALMPIFGICIMTFQAFSEAGASVASQFIGGGRSDRAVPTFLTTILLLGGLGLVVTGLLYAVHGRVGLWLGLSAETRPVATEYLRFVLPVIFIHAVRYGYSAVLVARGRTRWNMGVALLVNVVNLFLDHIWTMGTWGLPRMGVMGVAYATVAAQTLGLVCLMVVVHVHLGLPWWMKGLWASVRAHASPILQIGVPSAIEPVSFQLNQLVMVAIVAVIGDQALAARTYTLNIILFAIVLVFSVGLATQIKIAHQVGARRFDEAHRQLLRSLRLGMFLGLGGMALINAVAGPLLHVFTEDAAIVRMAQTLLLMGFILEPARTSNILVGGSLRGSGDARFVAVASIALTWGIAVPLAYVFGLKLGWGLVGVWLAMICDEALRSLMNYWRWHTGAWRTKGVLLREPTDAGVAH